MVRSGCRSSVSMAFEPRAMVSPETEFAVSPPSDIVSSGVDDDDPVIEVCGVCSFFRFSRMGRSRPIGASLVLVDPELLFSRCRDFHLVIRAIVSQFR